VANLTLSVDDDLLKRARMRALQEGTSVNALVREYLERFAGGDGEGDPMQGFLELARRTHASSGPQGRTWTREELYEERLGQR
jgi:plasmid stability protein